MYKDLLFIWSLILLSREEFLKNCGTGATLGAQRGAEENETKQWEDRDPRPN